MKHLTAVVCILLAVVGVVHFAVAEQDYYPQGTSANLSRPCNFAGVTTQVVALSATSAKTSNVTTVGTVRVICTQDAHMKVALSGVTGATATTGDLFITGYGPEYFLSPGGVFAFVRDSADGTCYVSDCK